jgi:diacylglycerol kinase (ATP)
VTTVAVVAHASKSLGGGLPELRRLLAAEGVVDPLWYEVDKSRKAPAVLRKALDKGADLVLVWGGDGMVQRAVDTLAGSDVTLGVLPAGTANLFATNLGIAPRLEVAVQVALHGRPRALDVGTLNGERFAVMAGAGLDAVMIGRADRRLKDRLGRMAYVWTGVQAAREAGRQLRVRVDGTDWFSGRASCVLLGSFGTLTGGLVAFPDADPSDGLLEVGVVTAEGLRQWAGVLGALALGRAVHAPFTHTTRGRKVTVRFAKPTAIEMDGGARPKTRRIRAGVEPGAIWVHVPDSDERTR